MPDPQISVSDRPTRADQLEQILDRARQRQEALRVRIPITLYSHDSTRAYVMLRDAAWNLQLPIAHTDADTIEKLVGAFDRFIRRLGELGIEGVEAKLDSEDQP